MWPEGEGGVAALLPQLVQGVQVGIDVVGVVGVGRVELQVPLSRSHHVLGGSPLRLALIVYHVKAYHLLRRHADCQRGFSEISAQKQCWHYIMEQLQSLESAAELLRVELGGAFSRQDDPGCMRVA